MPSIHGLNERRTAARSRWLLTEHPEIVRDAEAGDPGAEIALLLATDAFEAGWKAAIGDVVSQAAAKLRERAGAE